MNTQEMPADGRALPAAGELSEAVRAAQERLIALRRARGLSDDGHWAVGEREKPPVEDTRYEIRDTNADANSYLLSRISYFSEPLTDHLRAAAARRARAAAADDRKWLDELRATSYELRATSDELRVQTHGSASSLHSSFVIRNSSLVRVYPDIALAMLRTKTAAAGRVWLLLRHADAAGRGRIAVDEATRLLSDDGSPLRVCGGRQLRNLLRAGEGLYWQRDTARDGGEWLRLGSAARVAAGLGVARLGGSPVAVPVEELTGTIGRVRAHLYATFHSGRTRADLLTGERRARGPISRATLCKLSGAATNSQRNYERRARVDRRAAIAVGPRVAAADTQEMAWQRGRALFRLHDRRGRYGRPGAVYLAWQLPNEYIGPHATLPRGRQKRLNRALADLFHDGMTGNGEQITSDELRVTSYELRVQSAAGGGSVGQSPVSQSPVSQSPSLPLPPSPLPLFYNSARAAAGARHGRERYWRCGGVWLWQAEIRDTKYEIRDRK